MYTFTKNTMFARTTRNAALVAALLGICSPALAQFDDSATGPVSQRSQAPDQGGERAAPSSYQYDTGVIGPAWRFGNGEMFWMLRFSAVDGADAITSVSIGWGSVPNGMPARIHILQDPTNDGNPADRVLLASTNISVQNSFSGIFSVYPLPVPVPVSGDFYVAVSLVVNASDQFPMIADNTIPCVPQRVFRTIVASPPGIDPATSPVSDWPVERGYPLLRANGSNAGFTYQGRLTNSGTSYTGTGDIRATIYDAATGGNMVANTFVVSGVEFTQGLFSVRIPADVSMFDPGADDRWLEIEVRTPSGVGAFNVLSPRQRITSAPTAISAMTATTAASVPWTGITDVPANISLSPWEPAPGGIKYTGGLVGIGLATPAAPLSVAAVGGNGLLSLHNGAGIPNWILNLDSLPGAPGLYFSEVGVNYSNIVLRPGGNIGISTYPQLTLDLVQGAVVGNSTVNVDLFDPANRGLKVSFGYQGAGTGNFTGMRTIVEPGTNGCGNSGDLRFDTWECNTAGSREVMRIAGSGFVGIGTASPSSRLEVATAGVGGGWQMRFTNNAVPNFRGGLRLGDTGFFEATNTSNLVNPNFARLASTGAWTAVSDARLKTDVTSAEGLLGVAVTLNPVNFRWKSDGAQGLGLIAQDARKVLTTLVIGDESRDMLTLDYNQVAVVAIGAIQEQQAEITALKADNADLRARLEKLESMFAKKALEPSTK